MEPSQSDYCGCANLLPSIVLLKMNEVAGRDFKVLLLEFLEAETVPLAILFAYLGATSFSDCFDVVFTMLVLILYLIC